MRDPKGRMPCEALLRRAKANFETAQAIRLQTQRTIGKDSLVDGEPDRLEFWCVADGAQKV